MTVRRKLVLAFLAVTVVPFLALLIGLYGPAVSEGEELIGSRLKDNVEQAGRAIDQFMINCIREMKAFAADMGPHLQDPNGANAYLDRLTYFHPYFHGFSYADLTGKIVFSSDDHTIGQSLFDPQGEIRAEFDALLHAPEGSVYVLQIDNAAGTHSDMELQMIAGVFDHSGKCQGILSGNLVMQHLRDLLSDIDRRIPGERAAALLSKNGRILMSNLSPDRRPSAELDAAQLQAAIKQSRKDSGFLTHTDVGGAGVMSGFSRLWTYGANNAGNWILVASAPYEIIMGPVREAITSAAIILILAVAAAALLGSCLAHTLAQPVLRLTEGVRKIAAGDLSVQVDVSTKDETGELAASFNRMAAALREHIAALRQANDELESRVNQRTAELATMNSDLQEEVKFRKSAQDMLQATQNELADTARRAGMAEVATSVLHNVGNVLNSVNITTTMVSDRILNSKAANIGKVAALLKENEANIGHFISEDERGRQIPGYLTSLAEHLQQEQQMLKEDLSSLRKNVEHIKEIISMQQSYAKVCGVTELLSPTRMVEDALALDLESLARHDVVVIRKFEAVPEIMAERHKILQILVNLIRNAKHACNDSKEPRKRIEIQVKQEGEEVVIIVSDNGVGIPPQNLPRIFNHGFTTREAGHGFGLHNSAIVAKEMGGSLSGTSEGEGKGAVFTLRLPLNREARLA